MKISLTPTLVAVVFALMGCSMTVGCSLGHDQVDPTGNWATLLAWGPEACHTTTDGSFHESFVVTPTADGYAILAASTTSRSTGVFACTTDQCDLEFIDVIANPEPDVAGLVIRGHMVLDDQGVIRGAGAATYSMVAGGECGQAFLASGNLNLGVVVSP